MPILKMQALPQPGLDQATIQAALVATCEAIAAAVGVGAEHVWATWSELAPGLYVEGGNGPAESQPQQTHPPIGELICFAGRSREQIEAALQAAADTLGATLGLGRNVFITYREVAPGEVVADGSVVR
jgi:hypothetical protein